MPLVNLLRGPGQTAINPDEVIHHIDFERLPDDTTTVFLRLGNRSGMAVSVASAAVALLLGKGKIVEDVRVALGAVAPTAIRCPEAEAILKGQKRKRERKYLVEGQIEGGVAMGVGYAIQEEVKLKTERFFILAEATTWQLDRAAEMGFQSHVIEVDHDHFRDHAQ